MLLAADALTDGAIQLDSFWARPARRARRLRRERRPPGDGRAPRRRHLHAARRSSGSRGGRASASRPTQPGVVFLEIDGLALPVLRRAMRDGNAPNMARWLAEGTHDLTEWETDLSSQTGASQAGILLGSNEDIPAFRWVEKETGTMMTCSAPPDCAEIERRHSTGIGLLANGGASRGNLLSGEADHLILTVSKIEAEKKANPGYRAFLANGFNVTRALVLFFWEVDPRDHRLGPPAPARRAAARPPRRALPVHARRDVRRRPRPDRLRRPHGHDEGAPRDLRDLLELRRGRPPLRPRARRHAGGAAEARRAVRAHRPRAPLRAAAVRDRRPLRPRPDPGRDLQAAQRLRARRPGRALARDRERHRGGRRRRAGRRWSATRSARPPGARRSRSARRTTSAARASSSSARATSGSST